jgi:HEXXH motif-containing protein
MIPRPHVLTSSDLAALACGGGGAETVRTLVSARRSRTLLLICHIVRTAQDNAHTQRSFEALRQVQRAAPDAVDRVLDDPSVGAWATRAATQPRDGHPATASWLARVAIAAAVRGQVGMTVPVPTMPRISLPTLGTVTHPVSGDVVMRCAGDGTSLSDGVRIPSRWWGNGPGWRATPRVGVDSHGLRATFLLGRWPAGELPSGLHVSEEIDVFRWRDLVTEGWELLTNYHRQVAEELAALVTVLTPLRAVPGGMTSATLDDAFGCLFLSPAPDAQTLGVTLAHELQHTKLVALMDLFPLLEPVAGETFYAPWRDDPRPLAGLLHGTYAYTGVTAFWRRQRECATPPTAEMFAHTEFARWRMATLAAARSLLDSGRLTALGTTFVDGMVRVLDQWHTESVPKSAQQRAVRLVEEHRSRWLSSVSWSSAR